MKSDKEEGKDSAYYESSQDRDNNEQYADSDVGPSDASIRKLLHDNQILEYQNQLLQNKLYLTKQNCTLKQLDLISTIVSWFEDETRIDVENTKQTSQIQTTQEREKQIQKETLQTKSTYGHVQHGYTNSEVYERFNKPENLRTVISGSKVVADLRNNVTTLGNILKGLEDISRGELDQKSEQHPAATSSVGVQQLQRDQDGQKPSELSKTQKDKILQLMDSTTKQTMLKNSNKVKGDATSEALNKTSQESPNEIHRSTFQSSVAPNYQNLTSSFRKSARVRSEKTAEINTSNQTMKATDNEETVLAGSETTRKKPDVILGKRSFLFTKLSDDDVVSAKKYAEIPLLSSTAMDDGVFLLDEEKPLLSSTARDDNVFVFGDEKPRTKKTKNMLPNIDVTTDNKIVSNEHDNQEATMNLAPKLFTTSNTDKVNQKRDIPIIIASTVKDVLQSNGKHDSFDSTTLRKNTPADRQYFYDETVVSGNLTRSNGGCPGTATSDISYNKDIFIQKYMDLPLLSSTANKEEIEQSIDTCEVESRDLNYETLISGNILGIENDQQTFNSDISNDVFSLDIKNKPKLSSTTKYIKEIKQADANQRKQMNGKECSDVTNGDVFIVDESGIESPPLFSSTPVTSEPFENQVGTMAQAERTDNIAPMYSTIEGAGKNQQGKALPVTKLHEPRKTNLQVDPMKDKSHTNKVGSFTDYIASIQTNTNRPESLSFDHSEHLQVDNGNIPFSKYSQVDKKHVSKIRKGIFGHLSEHHDRLQSEGFEVKMVSPGESVQDDDSKIQFNNTSADTTNISRNSRVANAIQKEESGKHSRSTKPAERSRQLMSSENKVLIPYNDGSEHKPPITGKAEGTEIMKRGAKEVTKSFNQHAAVTSESHGAKFDASHQQNKVRQYDDTFEAVHKNIMENDSQAFIPSNKRIEKINKSVTFSNTGSRLGKVSNTSEKQFGDWSNDLNHLSSSLCKLETLLDELDQEGSNQQTSLHQRRQHAIRRFRIWKGLRSQKAGLDGSISGSLFDSSEILLTAESFGRRLSVDSKEQPIDLHEGSIKNTTELLKYGDVEKENKTNATNSPTTSDIVFKARLTGSTYPDETLFGELSFQLERRVLAYVFNGHSHTLLHGYNLRNIELMIRTQKGTLKESLQRRYEQITDLLHGYGWKPRVHAQFIYAMIHTYGTYRDVGKVRDLAKEKGWGNLSVLRHHVLNIIPGVHRCNMIVVMDCLMNLVANDRKTVFLW